MQKELTQSGPSIEALVQERYTEAARRVEPALCCPVEYDPALLEAIPGEVLERDYGCGDPSRHLQQGDCVLDLGSGSGKSCFLAAQIVGPTGRVIGVDANDEMLGLARRCRSAVAKAIGFENVEFFKARIQDLRLDLDQLDQWLVQQPVASYQDWRHMEQYAEQLRSESPLIADHSVDVVVSNCVLNLVAARDRRDLFAELARVLRPGGRAVISDIVSDRPVPEHLKDNPTLWSGCLSGAFQEAAFLEAFAEAGFIGIELMTRQAEPWAVIEGIEFRSLTVQAIAPVSGPVGNYPRAVIYGGPWKTVTDDRGQTFQRGQRTSVCGQTFEELTRTPYASWVFEVASEFPVENQDAGELYQLDGRPEFSKKPKRELGPESSGESCCGAGEPCR